MERFANYSKGMILALGADIQPVAEQEQTKPDKDAIAVRDAIEWVAYHLQGKDSPEDVLSWLQEEQITPKKVLGQGMHGIAFQVDHPEYGQNIVLKITESRHELPCIEAIYKAQLGTWSKVGGSESSLPHIYQFGDLPFAPLAGHLAGQGGYYLRDMYEINPDVSRSPITEVELFLRIFLEMGDYYYPQDVGSYNIAQGEQGQPVHFDPHCELEEASAQEHWIDYFKSQIEFYGPDALANLVDISTDEFVDQMIDLMGDDAYEWSLDEHQRDWEKNPQRMKRLQEEIAR